VLGEIGGVEGCGGGVGVEEDDCSRGSYHLSLRTP
jgi:hypothetical protein